VATIWRPSHHRRQLEWRGYVPPVVCFWNELGLVSPEGMNQRTPIATYSRGHKQLDMVYMSPTLYKASCGYIDCNETIIGADHSTMWIDIPAVSLHLLPPPPSLSKGWQLKTENPKIHDTYLQLYTQFCHQHKLFDHGKQLWSSVQEGIPLSLEQMMEFEMIDALCTKGMNDTKKLCQKMKMGAIEWSPEVAATCHCIAAWTALLHTWKGIKINSCMVCQLAKKPILPFNVD